jgi:outer membrane immunogenic protein
MMTGFPFKRGLLRSTFVLTAALSGIATAQDRAPTDGSQLASDQLVLSTAGGLDWSGYYVGGSLAFASGGASAVPIDAGRPDNDLEGAVFGAQLGYNIQRGNIVYGIEATLSATNAETGSTATGCSAVHCEYVDVNWLATLRGRAGVAVDQTLFYGSLGVATADVTAIDWDAGTASESHRHSGYVIGVGAEYSLSEKMSAKVEYNYMDFNDQTYNLGTPDAVEFDLSVVEVGINFHF